MQGDGLWLGSGDPRCDAKNEVRVPCYDKGVENLVEIFLMVP